MRRILLKLSGEYLQDEKHLWGTEHLQNICQQVSSLRRSGIEIGMVVGGGNIFRGREYGIDAPLDRCLADDIGMAATLINALAIQAYFLAHDLPAKVYGSQAWGTRIPAFHLESVRQDIQSNVLLFAGGTGHPFFSTDTAAALRACEIKADILLKATKVNGVYDKDPQKFPDAHRFENLHYSEALGKGYRIMDAGAFSLCMDQKLPIFIFNIYEENALIKAVHKEIQGTLVSE